MLAVVLGGGGAKGAYEIGVWRALIDLDMDSKIEIAVGTSIGSLNAALIAQGDYDKAVALWKNFDAGKMFHVDNYQRMDESQKTVLSMQSIAKGVVQEGGIHPSEYKDSILKYIDEDAVRSSRIQYGAVCVDFSNQTPVEKHLNEMKHGQLADYIMASSSLAPALKAYEIDGRAYIDGGFYDVLPINFAVAMGADEIIAVDLKSAGIMRKIEAPDKIKSLQYIKSYWNLGNVLVFDENRVQRNIMLGYLDTMKLYQVFDGNSYTFVKSRKNRVLNPQAKAKYASIKIEKSGERKLFSLADKLIEKNWQTILSDRNKKGVQRANDLLSCAEIAAEILEIDPTKIYTVESLNEKIKENLAKLEELSFPKLKSTKIHMLRKEVAAIADEKQRIKYFATEIQKDIKEGRDLWIQRLAPLFTKEFFVGLYLAVNDLV